MSDILSGPIWVSTVCKRYQQTTLSLGDIGLKALSFVNGKVNSAKITDFKSP